MRNDPTVSVGCDNPECGELGLFDMNPLAGKCWDNRYLSRQLDSAGWETVGDDEHYCPECAEDREAEREAACTTP